MTQAGALALVTGLDLEADAQPRADDPAPQHTPLHTPLRLTIPLLLAAGWGALLTFSVTFLMEDGRGAVAAPERIAARGEDVGAPFAPARSQEREQAPDRDTSAGAIRLVSASAEAVPSAIPPGPSAVAPAPAAPAPRSAGMPAERPDYIGTWGPTAQACTASHRRGYLPATITEEGARAGRTLCRFRNGHRDGIAWAMSAECSERGRHWTSQVRLLVDGDHLTWTSAKGATTYVRCGRRDG